MRGEFKIRDNKVKTISILIAFSLIPATWYLCGRIDKAREYDKNDLIAIENDKKCYGIGEHIISVPLSSKEDMRYNVVQHTYFPGYEPVDIAMTNYGKYDKNYTGGAIVYVNIEEVDGISRSFFELPSFNKGENDKKGTIREFGVGEHIISVPINDNISLDYYQYMYHEGYEVVGMAADDHAYEHSDYYDGGVILYKNITPVKCTCNDNGYTSFGTPIEKEYTKKLTYN